MKAVANLDTMIVGLNMSVQNYGAPKRKVC